MIMDTSRADANFAAQITIAEAIVSPRLEQSLGNVEELRLDVLFHAQVLSILK